MIPGMKMSPRMLKQLKKQLKSEEIEDVEEVIIRTPSKELIFKNPTVTSINMMGQSTYQIIGEPKVVEKGIPREDILLVAKQANVSEEEARKALEECDGELAEAIIKLMG